MVFTTTQTGTVTNMEFPKVYLAWREFDYDDWRVIGVFTTKEGAERLLVKHKANFVDDRGHRTEVEEFDLED